MTAAVPFLSNPAQLLAWARSLHGYLTRADVRVTETVEQVVTPITEDSQDTLAAVQTYAQRLATFFASANEVAQAYYDAYQQAAAANQSQLAQSYLQMAIAAESRTVTLDDGLVVARADKTIAAYLAGTAASISTLEEAVANGDDSVALKIDTVTAQSAGNSTSIQQITQAAPGTAKYAVVVDVNGHVTGMFQLSTGIQGTDFTVVADRFVIANPSDSGDLQTVFVVGNVGGVPTVGINGDLIVDGTINAPALNVGTLDAITGNVGTLNAGIIQSTSGDMVIDLDNGTIDINI